MDPNLQSIVAPAQATIDAAAAAQQIIDGQTSQINGLNQTNQQLTAQQQADDAAIQTLQSSLTAANAHLAAIANTKVFDHLEMTPWLIAPGTAANTNETGSTASTSQAQTLPPSTLPFLGLSPAGPYANAFFYKTLGADPSKTAYKYELQLFFASSTDAAASQCVELDIQQVIGGLVYNTGLQFNFVDNALRVWNRNGKAWVATGVASPRWTAGKWMSVTFETHRDAVNVYVDAITVNGIRIPSALSFTAPNLGLGDMLNCAIQLDGNKAGTAYRLYLGPVKFTAS